MSRSPEHCGSGTGTDCRADDDQSRGHADQGLAGSYTCVALRGPVRSNVQPRRARSDHASPRAADGETSLCHRGSHSSEESPDLR